MGASHIVEGKNKHVVLILLRTRSPAKDLYAREK